MEIIYFTLTAIILYTGTGWILNRIEIARGERLKQRNLFFFIILLTMAVVSFGLLQRLLVA